MNDLAKRQLEMTPEQWTLIQEEAHLCESEVTQVDAQARQIIAGIRNRYPGGRVSDASQIPKPPETLFALQRQRDAVIQRHVEKLQRALGASAFVHLDSNLQTRFAPKIRRSMLPPSAKAATGPRTPQFLQGK
jgi:hypothetical protein